MRLLDPADAAWQLAEVARLPLQGTPAAMQPSAAIRNHWQQKPIGAIGSVEVRALCATDALAFHLRWADAVATFDHGDNSRFPDAAAIALPLHADAPLPTMGAPEAPLTAWYWRADSREQGFQVLARGPGTTRIVDRAVQVGATWADGRWQVVIARRLHNGGIPDTIDLSPGQALRFGVAVWEGSHGERGGLKAFSGDWRPLRLAGA
jgi:complex iron-sulfur molybdoenzyme family reductase subunit gamma